MEKILNQILSQLQEMKKDQNEMRVKFDSFEERLESFDERQRRFEEKLLSFDERLLSFDERQQSLEQQFASFKEEQQAMKAEMRQGFNNVHKRIDKIENRMESEVIDKIRILFDARELFNDNLIAFRKEFNLKFDDLYKRDLDKSLKLDKLLKVINLEAIK